MDDLGKNFKLKKDVDFELTSDYSGFQRINDNWMKMFPPYLGLPIEYSYIDKKGAGHHIRYVESRGSTMNHVTRAEVVLLTPAVIEFQKGRVKCSASNLALYWFLINHPDCATNEEYKGESGKQKLLNRARPCIFLEINRERERELTLAKEEKVIDMTYILSKRSTEADLRELYAFYEQPNAQEADLQAIKIYLLAEARKDPDKMKRTIEDSQRSFTALVNDGEDKGVLVYKKQERMWKLKDQTESICSVPSGINPKEHLVKWLKENDTNGEVQGIIKEMMTQAEKAAV